MQPIRIFNVFPTLPTTLEPLRTLAYNLHWSWNPETIAVFRRLDRDLWDSSHHNPVLMLGKVSQQRLEEVADNDGFLAQVRRAMDQLEDYLKATSWYSQQRPNAHRECYAYFSAEFGLTDCLPIYSGGLGVLAGDHLKSASDLGLPLVGVGLLYQKGYFSQYLDSEGWQQERYPINDFYNMPLHLEHHADGSEIRVSVDYPQRTVYARVWRVQVGRVPLYLLDTNIPENNSYDQDITDYLYGGDLDMRIHQEIMLGVGGVRMLAALGLEPTVYHMNEGHSAFLSLERIQALMAQKHLSFTQAKQVTQSSQVFTTHTPVPAGIDLFPADKVMYYVGHYAQTFDLSRDEFLALGREQTGDLDAPFSMANFAIKMATFVNGVSQLHGQVSRKMFKGLWPNIPKADVPITAITNGIHARSRVAEPIQEMYDRYLGPRWATAMAEDHLWERVARIPDEELWRTHERCRYQLVAFARDRWQLCLQEMGASPAEVQRATEVLDPTVLTIGFARRFATYKRATLFLKDLARIRNILLGHTGSQAGQRLPQVQFVIAGKAHPRDTPGKELIREVMDFSRQADVGSHVVFIPDYDLHVAKLMVAGCDVWMNTPLRPLEASGTSGMKAAMNGGLNLSTLDGWWDEADYHRTGWPIGTGEVYEDLDYQSEMEANALYDRLEKEVVPLFYDRDDRDVPRGWVAKMKDAIRLNGPYFNTTRMVRDYARQAYFPASDRYHTVTADDYAPAKNLAQWKAHLFEHWYDLKVLHIDVSAATDVAVNDQVTVKAHLQLGQLQPQDVQVMLYQGPLNESNQLMDAVPTLMAYQAQDHQGNSLFTATVAFSETGQQGLAMLVLPKHPHLSSPYEMDLVLWA